MLICNTYLQYITNQYYIITHHWHGLSECTMKFSFDLRWFHGSYIIQLCDMQMHTYIETCLIFVGNSTLRDIYENRQLHSWEVFIAFLIKVSSYFICYTVNVLYICMSYCVIHITGSDVRSGGKQVSEC